MSLQPARRLITVKEYQLMAASGILTEQDRVELVNGEIFHMSPIGSRHAACVNRMANHLIQQLLANVIVSVQNPVVINEHSCPEPDIALLRPADHYYADQHPGPDDILLLIEVAETSIVYDREVKLSLYASAGVAECWLVDLENNWIESYRLPSGGAYKIRELLRPGEQIQTAFSKISFHVTHLIGKT
ncbi:MAG: Uma2 family endonuclease [Bacteroidota bacterium]